MRNGDLSPVAIQVALWKLPPGYGTDQVQNAHGGRTFDDKTRQTLWLKESGVQIGAFAAKSSLNQAWNPAKTG